MINNKTTIAERIRACREKLGLSQRELAAAAGTNQTSISAWETGVIPRRDGMRSLAKVLNVSLEWLRDGEEEQVGIQPDDYEKNFIQIFNLLDEVTEGYDKAILPKRVRSKILPILLFDAQHSGLHTITVEKIRYLINNELEHRNG